MLKFKRQGVDLLKSVKILHCADVHIGALENFLGEKAVSRRFETLSTFEKIIDTAAEKGSELLLIAGDLFDSDSVEDSLVRPVLGKIASVPQIKVIYAAGNHDPLNINSPFNNKKYALPQNLFVLGTEDDCKNFEELGVRVYGRSFESVYMQGRERFSLSVPDDDFVNIMVLHGELRSDLNSNYNSVTREFIERCGIDYIALGHIHKFSGIGELSGTFYAYPGCPEGQGFDELGEKGVISGVISRGSCELEFVPTAKRMHSEESIDISGLAGTAEIYEKIISDVKEKYGESFGENLYKFILKGTPAFDGAVNTAELTVKLSGVTYYAKVKDCTDPVFDGKALESELSLKGLFYKTMKKRIETADPGERETLEKALYLGLRAFTGEVTCDED